MFSAPAGYFKTLARLLRCCYGRGVRLRHLIPSVRELYCLCAVSDQLYSKLDQKAETQQFLRKEDT